MELTIVFVLIQFTVLIVGMILQPMGNEDRDNPYLVVCQVLLACMLYLILGVSAAVLTAVLILVAG